MKRSRGPLVAAVAVVMLLAAGALSACGGDAAHAGRFAERGRRRRGEG